LISALALVTSASAVMTSLRAMGQFLVHAGGGVGFDLGVFEGVAARPLFEVGGVAAAGFKVDTPTRITAASPAGTVGTTVRITITSPLGTSATSSADQFTYANVAKNNTTGDLYTSLATALAAALAGNEIRILDTQLDGNFILDESLTLYGGWDSTFLSPGAQPTKLNGSLTVKRGDSTVRTVVVKG